MWSTLPATPGSRAERSPRSPLRIQRDRANLCFPVVSARAEAGRHWAHWPCMWGAEAKTGFRPRRTAARSQLRPHGATWQLIHQACCRLSPRWHQRDARLVVRAAPLGPPWDANGPYRACHEARILNENALARVGPPLAQRGPRWQFAKGNSNRFLPAAGLTRPAAGNRLRCWAR